jgi:hypothetical protein
MTKQITLEEALKLVSFDYLAKWRVLEVNGNVDGDVLGNVNGDVNGDVDGDVNGDVDGYVNGNVNGDVLAQSTVSSGSLLKHLKTNFND